MAKGFLSSAIVVGCCVPLSCQSPPTKAPPKSIFGVYSGAEKPGRDTIRVTPAAHGKIAVALKLYYASGHTCSLNKEGEWLGDRMLIATEGITANEPCKLEAYFPAGRILLKDEGQRCARVYCGTRGTLDAVSLRKRHKK